MTDTDLNETVSVVLERDVPVRLVWKGTSYYVDQAPVALGRTLPTPVGSAPHPGLVTGWRVRGSSAKGESHTFDVKSSSYARWKLASVRD